jgi:hypothetical protein
VVRDSEICGRQFRPHRPDQFLDPTRSAPESCYGTMSA